MDPDLIFLVGLIVLGLAFPATLAAFSTSGRTFRPVAACILIGSGMVVYAMSHSSGGYSVGDIPRIVAGLFS